MALDHRVDGLAQLVNRFKPFVASTALIQRLNLPLRLRYTGAQGSLSRLGLAQGTHHQAPLSPALARPLRL